MAEAADTERQIEIQANGGNGTAYRPPPRTKEIMIRNQVRKGRDKDSYINIGILFDPPGGQKALNVVDEGNRFWKGV